MNECIRCLADPCACDRRSEGLPSAPMDAVDVPRIRIEDLASSFHEFHLMLFSGALPLPCWLEVGDAAHKVTAENHRELARGMLLCLEVRGLFSE